MAAEEGQHSEQSPGEPAAQVPAPPHVFVFPYPALGNITPMLTLAELLSLAGIRVTFLNTDHNHRRLLCSVGVRARLARCPGLHLRSIPDGLSEDNPRNVDSFKEMVESLEATARPLFRVLLASGGAEHDGAPPVTCLVADGFIEFTVDVAEELGVPVIAFRTSSACSFWAYQCIPNLIASGIIPFQKGCDMDELVASVPGTESFLRRRDLPSFCRARGVEEPVMRYLNRVIQNATRYRGLVFNTAEFAEGSVLTHIRSQVPSTYPIGPLHGLLKAGTYSNCAVQGDGAATPNSAGLWQEDRACMEWLDARAPASVVYASFGSVIVLRRDQLLELWHGLANSGHHFLWAARPGLIVDGVGDGGVPAEVAEATKERAFLVGWEPQQEVLAHPAVGCFLTHSGWNSTLESMWAGVPMVCWPHFADQHINSRFVSEVWGIGVDMKDTCDRATVEKAVREVMGSSKMREAAASISKRMRETVEPGGSSRTNLERLIRDIRSTSFNMLE